MVCFCLALASATNDDQRGVTPGQGMDGPKDERGGTNRRGPRKGVVQLAIHSP